MKKFSFRKILYVGFLSMCISSISCGRSNDEPKPSPVVTPEKCSDEKAINNGGEAPCEYEKSKPDTLSISVSVIDTELADGSLGGKLAAETKYRTIVYKEDGSYFLHNDYIVDSDTNENFSLIKSDTEKYTIVVYSFNSIKDLPEVTDAEKGNINTALLNFDVNQGQLMYAKVENYKPLKNENIELKLKHKFIPFTLTIDNGATPSDFYKIEKVEYAKINNNQKGEISLSSGNITNRTDLQEQNLIFPGDILPLGKEYSSTPIWLNIEKETNLIYKLKTDLSSKIGTTFMNDDEIERKKNFDDKEINKIIKIQNSSNQEIIKKQKCGAWMSDTKFLEFMCLNLGASASSFDSVVNLGHPLVNETGTVVTHPTVGGDFLGAKYLWGKKNPIVTQEEDLNLISETIEWGNRGDYPVISDDLAWRSDTKTLSDPCPNGYRIPGLDEINAIFEYNRYSEDFTIDEKSLSYFSLRFPAKFKKPFTNSIAVGYFLILQSAGYYNSKGEYIRENDYVNIAVATKGNDNIRVRSVKLGDRSMEKIQVIPKGSEEEQKRYAITVHCVKE